MQTVLLLHPYIFLVTYICISFITPVRSGVKSPLQNGKQRAKLQIIDEQPSNLPWAIVEIRLVIAMHPAGPAFPFNKEEAPMGQKSNKTSPIFTLRKFPPFQGFFVDPT